MAEIARAAGASDRAVSFYLSGQRHPRAEVPPRLARAVGVDDPLDLCDLPKDGERVVHLRVRVGKSRAAAAGLGWHPETYREWETRGDAPDKMAGPRDRWEDDPRQPGWGWRVRTPFFTRPMVEKGASIDGTWRPPVYGPHEYSKPEHGGVSSRYRPSASTRRSSDVPYMPDEPPDVCKARTDQAHVPYVSYGS